MKSRNTDIEEQVIQKIKQLRIERNISQLALSNILSISDGQIGNIESPRYQHKYTLKQIYTFCSFIKYPFECIFLTKEELAMENNMTILIEKIIEYEG